MNEELVYFFHIKILAPDVGSATVHFSMWLK